MLYSNFAEMDIVTRNTLDTSYSSLRFASHADYPSYVSHQKIKLKIIRTFNSSTVNPHNVCVVVILTLITKPTWNHIPCGEVIPANYFICELNVPNIKPTTYYRHTHQCHKLYTYHRGECWLIQYNIRPLVLNSSTIYSSFFITLSAWAHGHTVRNRIQININSATTPYCLSTNGLPNHFRKTWISAPCKQNDVLVEYYTLGQLHPTSYTYTCSGIVHFNCRDNTCILASYVCDGYYDCPDKSDEFNSICVKIDLQDDGCGDFYFQCMTGRCIHATLHCDNWQHCDDGSDEIYCSHSHNGWINSDLNTDTVDPYLIQVINVKRRGQVLLYY